MTAILINEPSEFPIAALNLLKEYGPVHIAGESFDPASIEAIFVRLADRLDAQLTNRYPNLRFIVSPTTGLDHIDIEHFTKHGVEIFSLRGQTDFLDGIRATAEHTLALALALVRRIPQAVHHTQKGGWDRYLFKGTELYGKRILLLGYGRIGRQLERLYEAFGCRVSAHDLDSEKIPLHLRCDYYKELTQTDVLSIHVNLTPTTIGLVNETILSKLPAHAIVINTARGQVVDQPALLRMLKEGRLAGAALDVLNNEPNPFDYETMKLIESIDENSLLLTPHIGGYTEESLNKVEIYMAQVFIERLRQIDVADTSKKLQDPSRLF